MNKQSLEYEVVLGVDTHLDTHVGALINASESVRGKLWQSKPEQCVESCARLRSLGGSKSLKALTMTLRLLAKRWRYLTEELKELDGTLEDLT
jgi:hypothetical protein